MKILRLVINIVFLIALLTGCKCGTEKIDAFTNDNDTPINDFINIKVSTPISLGVGMINNTDNNYILLLQLYDGIYKEQYWFGNDFGSSWIGKYQLVIIDAKNNNLVSTYKLEEWEEPLNFKDKLELSLEDYNQDGTLDFLIGQYATNNYNLYRMYYITEDLEIGYYDKLGEITMSTLSLSPSLKRGDDGTLEYYYYDNIEGKEIHKKIDLELLEF